MFLLFSHTVNYLGSPRGPAFKLALRTLQPDCGKFLGDSTSSKTTKATVPMGRAGKAHRFVSSAPRSTAVTWPRAFTSQLGLDSLPPPICPLCHPQLSTWALFIGTPNGSTRSPCLGQDQKPAGAPCPLGLGVAARTSGLFSSMFWPRMPLCTFGTVLASHCISSLTRGGPALP